MKDTDNISFVIPYRAGGDPWRAKAFNCVAQHLMYHFPTVEVVVRDSDPNKPFDRSKARNLGAKDAKGEILVFLDADTLVVPEQLINLFNMLDHAPWGLPYTDYFTINEPTTQKIFDGGRDFVFERKLSKLEIDHHFPSEKNPEPAVAGCVVCIKDAYQAVQGYDERFYGWGEEDRAFVLALETLTGPMLRVQGSIFHLWHPPPVEGRFEQPHFEANRSLCNRYRNANGDKVAMKALAEEHALTLNSD